MSAAATATATQAAMAAYSASFRAAQTAMSVAPAAMGVAPVATGIAPVAGTIHSTDIMELVRLETEVEQARFDRLSASPMAHPIIPPIAADFAARRAWADDMNLPNELKFSRHLPFLVFETLEGSALYRLRWGAPS